MQSIDLLRHGLAVGGRLYRGNKDDVLSDKGWMQMSAATDHKLWDVVVGSTLLRCNHFTKALSNEQDIPYELDYRLEEIGFGIWQGKSPDEIGLDVIKAFKKDPIKNKPEGAENLVDFQKRVLEVYQEILLNFPDQEILIVTHAGVIRVIKAHILGIELNDIFNIEVPMAKCEHFILD